MDINRTGVTVFNDPNIKLIYVLCQHGPKPEIVAGQNYPGYFNADDDAAAFMTKALMQGDTILLHKTVREGKEFPRLLYVGPDGMIVEGANQDGQ